MDAGHRWAALGIPPERRSRASGGQYRKLQFSIGVGVVDSTAASAIESFGDKLQLVVERAHWDSSEGGIGTCTQLG
jgi:hypothetical protein